MRELEIYQAIDYKIARCQPIPPGGYKARKRNSLHTLPNHDRIHSTENLSINMWSRLTLCTGVLLAALFLVAIYSPAAATPLPDQSCCPDHPWCCVQTTTLDPCALIFPDCLANPYHRCCPRYG
ncbi:uncharacterized protein [Penaeus vannamei]|uniref:uncharacterized protein n=1 Tax=Penaeus vannamei TaxID=6689 RepID=UPI00387FB194